MTNHVLGMLLGLALAVGSTAASATTLSIPFTPGDGNSNQNFIIDTNGDVEIGIKAKNRFVGDIVPTGNVYQAFAGESDPGLALWNVDYSVDLGAGDLTDYVVLLTVDFNPAVSNLDTSTGPFNGTLPGDTSIIQGSQNLGFGFWAALPNWQLFDPFAPGEYELGLTVLDATDNSSVASVTAFVNVAPVPLPPALALGALGLGALTLVGRKRRKS